MSSYIHHISNILSAHLSHTDRPLYLRSRRHWGLVDVVHIFSRYSTFTDKEITRDATEFNEVKRLRQRIAELESVIRELKKNPHPRWTAPGGIVHDPNFFDSFRRSTQHDTAENICLSSAEIVDVTSMGVPVKAEENISCPPELVATTAIAHDILHSSPHAHPPQLPEPAVLCSRNSEVTRTGLDGGTTTTGITPYGFHDGPLDDVENLHLDLKSTPMSQTATSINTVISCNPFMTNLPGDSLSATRGPRFSNYTPTPTCEFQAAASAPVSQTDAPQISHKNLDSCNCLMDPLAFGPLLHLGISLRTSREALETLHPLSSDCVLYCQISILEKHILWAPPILTRNFGADISRFP